MAPRRAHKKSRTGCLSCRKRRVKCDESRPKCGNCISRQIECLYASASEFRSYSPVKPSKPYQQPQQSTLPHRFSEPSPPPPPPSRDLFELELMLQWSTKTHQSFCGDMEDEYFTWQYTLAREALSQPFLLNGMLSFAALELAVNPAQPPTVQRDYISAALSYHATGLKLFRNVLSNPTPENQQSILAFSMITMYLSLAIPHFTKSRPDEQPQSMVTSILEHFELMHGVTLIMLQHGEALKETPILRNLPAFHDVPNLPLDPSTTTALAALSALNESVHNSVIPQPGDNPSILKSISAHATNRAAIFHLSTLFAKCQDPKHRGYAVTWLNFAGREFLTAVKAEEPVALVVLMHWGVLIERCKADTWFMQPVGKALIAEMLEAVAGETNEQLRSCVAWVESEVDLSVVSNA